MKSKNNLNSIFEREDLLSRDDISRYLNEKSGDYSIEKKANQSSFEQDALEGFELTGATTEDLKKLDNKFKITFNFNYLWTFLITSAGFSLLFFAIISKDENQIVSKNSFSELSSTNSVESSLILKETTNKTSENQYIDVDNKNGEHILNLTDIKSIKEDSKENFIKMEQSEIEVNEQTSFSPLKLPIKLPELISSKYSKSLKFRLSKELYLHDFKVIDYRLIRPELSFTGELTGTPANTELPSNKENWIEQTEQTIEYMDFLKEALGFLKAKEWKKADAHFEKILSQFPEDRNANFYLAFSLLNQEKFSLALNHFEKAYDIELMNFYEESKWLSAKIYVAMNQKEKSQELLKLIIAQNGFYAEQAKELLTKGL